MASDRSSTGRLRSPNVMPVSGVTLNLLHCRFSSPRLALPLSRHRRTLEARYRRDERLCCLSENAGDVKDNDGSALQSGDTQDDAPLPSRFALQVAESGMFSRLRASAFVRSVTSLDGGCKYHDLSH